MLKVFPFIVFAPQEIEVLQIYWLRTANEPMFAHYSLHLLFFQQDRANIRRKLSSTGRHAIELSFAEMASFAGNCFELTDGKKRCKNQKFMRTSYKYRSTKFLGF